MAAKTAGAQDKLVEPGWLRQAWELNIFGTPGSSQIARPGTMDISSRQFWEAGCCAPESAWAHHTCGKQCSWQTDDHHSSSRASPPAQRRRQCSPWPQQLLRGETLASQQNARAPLRRIRLCQNVQHPSAKPVQVLECRTSGKPGFSQTGGLCTRSWGRSSLRPWMPGCCCSQSASAQHTCGTSSSSQIDGPRIARSASPPL
mmetsp:Transcript_36604/g.104607  ORF Transcript_36604/g.104607 Transcript_36604/m.104607 type:complete len:202 (+) Transcript_36604:300-905(+)